MKAIQQRLIKLDKDLADLRNDGNQTILDKGLVKVRDKDNQTWAWEQYRRKELVRKVCQKYDNPKELQQVKSFIMDPKVRVRAPASLLQQSATYHHVLFQSKTIYCFNHKAGSTTWMAAYSELVDDKDFVKMTRKNKQYYK